MVFSVVFTESSVVVVSVGSIVLQLVEIDLVEHDAGDTMLGTQHL
jgi:hypothetical protein